jgi:hypothetical protein
MLTAYVNTFITSKLYVNFIKTLLYGKMFAKWSYLDRHRARAEICVMTLKIVRSSQFQVAFAIESCKNESVGFAATCENSGATGWIHGI